MATFSLESDGRLGYFWPLGDEPPRLDDDPLRGWVRRDDTTLVDVLDEAAQFPAEGPPNYRALAGALQGGSVLLLDVRFETSSRVLGGAQASWARYSARTVLDDVDLVRLRSDRVRRLRANFFGVGRWAGMKSGRESWDTGTDGIVRGYSLSLSTPEVDSHVIGGGRRLTLSSAWSVGGSEEQRLISAPVSVECESARPVRSWSLLEPLLRVQDLLSLAYGGSVLAETGAGVADLRPADRPGTDASGMWSSPLMRLQTGGRAAKLNSFPLFTLQTIGGLLGVRRWIKLSQAHQRAVAPLVAPLRHGFSSADVLVRDVAAAMEYWTKVNRPAKWASTKLYAQAITGRLDSSFEDWVGDRSRWCTEFWSANNHLKHEPSYAPDDQRLIDLALSGRYALLASLLDRVAGTRESSRALFGSHRLADLGRRLRGETDL
jgi:hypothetical protein